MFAHSGIIFACATISLWCLIQAEHAYHETLDKCMKETGTTMDEITSISGENEASHNFRCWVHCCLRSHDLISDDGILNRDLILNNTLPEYTDWITGCVDKPSSNPDPCEKAYDFFRCLADANPEFFELLAEDEND